jgi:1,2-diacylglycerol 3-alpha-glucosyltransferase
MSEKLKIAFYTDSFLPAVDGVVISILSVRKELEKRGHEVYIFASGNEKTKEMVKNDSRIVVVRGLKFNKYPQYNLALFPMISKIKTMHMKFDINHAHTPFMMGVHALMLSKIDRIPVVGSFHTMFTDDAVLKEYLTGNKILAKTIKKYSWRYAQMFYNRCDAVAAPSQTIERMLKKKKIKRVRFIPNGINIKKFNPNVDGTNIRSRFVKRNEKLVMYVGRLGREKRLETLINAARIMKNDDIKFVLVGSGPAQTHYQKMVEHMHLQDKVKFTGFVKNELLPKYYAACDAFCIPSTFETQGLVSLEAMGCGKPVIGANYLALKELIENGKNGEKFTPNDGNDCARKIKKVLYNINSYKYMVKTAERYSIEHSTDHLLELYRRVLNNEGS